MESWIHDLRFSLRAFAQRPTFTALAVATLALGIGMTSSIFSIVHAVLFEPLPIDDASRVVMVDRMSSAGHRISVSIPTFQDWRDRNRSFEDLGAFRWSSSNLTDEGEAARLASSQVTPGFFRALGREPLSGRLFGDEAGERGAPREAVVSERFWDDRLGRRADVLGSTLRLDGEPFTVIGVLPADFIFPSRQISVWLPLGAFAEQLPWDKRGSSPGLYAVGRLKDGVTRAQVDEDFTAMTAQIAEISGNEEPTPRVQTLPEALLGQVRAPLLTLLGAVGFVLAIACANVASLLLARGESRSREIATRRAVGASRGRIVRQLLTESVVLAAAGGLLGLLVARASLDALVAWLPSQVPLLERVALDGRVLGWMLAVTLLTGLVFGTVPALLASRTDLISELREGARQAGRRHPLLQALVVFELTAAVVLLVGAGLLTRSLLELSRVDPGFRADGVITMRLSLPAATYDEGRWPAFYDQLVERVDALPGVEHAAVNSLVPLWSGGSESMVVPEGVEPDPKNGESVLFQSASAGYFEALGVPLLQGRTFLPTDVADAPHIVVIDKTLAETFWPGEPALGRRIAFEFDIETDPPSPIWREVVGVVGHSWPAPGLG